MSTDDFIYDGERQNSFTAKIKGMPPDAVEKITKSQPYQRENSELETLSLISRLENAPALVAHRGRSRDRPG